jgi:hypothetical protein
VIEEGWDDGYRLTISEVNLWEQIKAMEDHELMNAIFKDFDCGDFFKMQSLCVEAASRGLFDLVCDLIREMGGYDTDTFCNLG